MPRVEWKIHHSLRTTSGSVFLLPPVCDDWLGAAPDTANHMLEVQCRFEFPIIKIGKKVCSLQRCLS